MKHRLIALMTPSVLAVFAVPSYGHHSWPAVFHTHEIVVEGEIGEIHIRSPHTWIFVNVIDEAGDTERWDVELGPAAFMRRMFADLALKVGDQVMVVGNPGREHARWLHFQGLYRAADDRFFGTTDPRSARDASEVSNSSEAEDE